MRNIVDGSPVISVMASIRHLPEIGTLNSTGSEILEINVPRDTRGGMRFESND